ncbi:similar to Saccharomyces cerevisiae YPR141C KAR3 Minus-end-directed microtubule motor that functions in mitosis and meiosis [Maudiozyma saulgeensis]|uniref:Kinesin-like protein n=1 Tax=Maudiozyma saulgeensis TaxID=1789683 RepID=A0A1X7RAU5_9SACH|nr:similar to Saccharomyces cerevisiae YPR141C KAR3 Minus-end-directed microtubule motor that functions in mitosis and meiosis [Kazachstania saulgeensis]
MRDVPTTPLRVSREPSLIPSPTGKTKLLIPSNMQQKRRYTSSPPSKIHSSSSFQSEKRNTIHSRVPQNDLSNSSASNSSANLTKFYKSNVLELNELQETLYRKKSILDARNDEFETYKLEQQEVQIKWDKIASEKRRIENELKLKQNELKRCENDNIEKKQILERGHALHLKELEAKNQSELNKLRNEYDMKIEKLKQDRIKEFEKKRSDLLNEVEGKRNKILMNDSILADLKQELDNKYLYLREEWLEKYQQSWTEEIEKRTKMTQDIEIFEHNLNDDIYPKIDILTTRLNDAKSKYAELQKILEERSFETKDLVSKITEKNEQIKQTKDSSTDLVKKIDDIKKKLVLVNNELIKEETIRRTLHNNLQELRGNIRVYCRIRPVLPRETQNTTHLKVTPFDDTNGTQEIDVTKRSVHANSTTPQTFHFKFDKIFNTKDSNSDVFDEVGQLVQSALDGYNVCIFAYGQTGSGKTYTMLNPQDGIIPLTIVHIFDWTENLKERGWKYTITCQFIEIYNENIVDLLRNTESGEDTEQTKHDIRHNMETQRTTITNITTCELDCEATVNSVLKKASKLRSTASTKSNEHSSRSHSIFIVHLAGENSNTGERSEGTLNLIDLAGSERINVAHVDGERLRETQHINKSLSCLGDVIHALNDSSVNKRHIPFRNSKLTYLLQNSLTGNSKTLMFVNISSASNHVNETLNSLRFASKVNSTKMQKST